MSRRHLPWLALGLIFALHGVANLVWVDRDQTLRSFDMGPHLEAQLYVYAVVKEEGLSGLVRAARGADSSIWPPTTYLPGTLWAAAVGHSIKALRMLGLAYIALLLGCLLVMGRRIHSARAGLLAAAVVMFYPGVYGESRQLGMDLPGCALLTLDLALMMACAGFARTGRALALGLAVGAAVLVRPHNALFLLLPSLCLGLLSLLRPAAPRGRVLLNMALAVGAALALSSIWWWGRLGEAWSELTPHAAGLRDAFHHGPSWLFYLHAMPWCTSPYLLLMALVAMAALAARWWRRRRRGAAQGARTGWDQRGADQLLLWAWLVGGLLALCIIGVSHLRYLLPVAPPLALLCARGLLCVPRRHSRRIMIGLALAVGGLTWLVDSFGARPQNFSYLDTPMHQYGRIWPSSGPPRAQPLVGMGQQLARFLASRHQSGDGVFVQIATRGLPGVQYRWNATPPIIAALPGAVVTELTFQQLREHGARHLRIGATVVPLRRVPLRHCYRLFFEAAARAPLPGGQPERKVYDRWLVDPLEEPRGKRRVTLWYRSPCGGGR